MCMVEQEFGGLTWILKAGNFSVVVELGGCDPFCAAAECVP